VTRMEQTVLPAVEITGHCNYIAAFLTMACPYRCSYCINTYESPRRQGPLLGADAWIAALSRLVNLDKATGQVPVTLQGGEPSVHPGFYEIINGLPERIRIDVLTNLCFDVEEMIGRVKPERLRREAPYASIRVSYHPSEVSLDELLGKTHRLLEAGFHVGIWAVLVPGEEEPILAAQERGRREGIDFRTKEFLGFHGGQLYGQYDDEGAVRMEQRRRVMCSTSELLMGPDGSVYRCHRDLYAGEGAIGNILDPSFEMSEEYRLCEHYGHCNPCDRKVKTNRRQEFGHVAVRSRFVAAGACTGESQVGQGMSQAKTCCDD